MRTELAIGHAGEQRFAPLLCVGAGEAGCEGGEPVQAPIDDFSSPFDQAVGIPDQHRLGRHDQPGLGSRPSWKPSGADRPSLR